MPSKYWTSGALKFRAECCSEQLFIRTNTWKKVTKRCGLRLKGWNRDVIFVGFLQPESVFKNWGWPSPVPLISNAAAESLFPHWPSAGTLRTDPRHTVLQHSPLWVDTLWGNQKAVWWPVSMPERRQIFQQGPNLTTGLESGWKHVYSLKLSTTVYAPSLLSDKQTG